MAGDTSRPTHRSLNWVWDIGLLTWVVETQPAGGGSVTIAKSPQTASAPTAHTVNGASVLIVAANTSRTGLVITLLSSTHRVSLGFSGNAAVLDSGETLTQYGSVYYMTDFDYSTGDVYAIASGVGTVVSIQEYV